jgi:hypothetical protein
VPKSESELEDDETISACTYIYEDRVVTIWESNVYDHDGQDEENDIARNRIIWERLNPASDWFFCHTDGTRIGDGEVIPHRAHVIIGLREEVDPDWRHRAMQESKETFTPPTHWLEDESDEDEPATNTDPEPAQPECLAPTRLVQLDATARVVGGKDALQDADSDITQGKSASCTADEGLRSELEALRSSIPDTLRAIITFGRQSVQMSFSPENAIAHFRRKVEEIWGIPRNVYWLSMNGKHETLITSWPQRSTVEIHIRGPAGGFTGAVPDEDTNETDDGTPVPPREKFQKGFIKLGIAGGIYRVHTSLTIEQVVIKFDLPISYEYWLPNGRKVACEEKLRHMFPPGTNQTHFVDEVIPGESRKKLKELGPVMLKIGEKTITILNNQTFEEAFIKEEIELQSDFILLPNGLHVNAKEVRIRQFLEMDVDDITEVRWDFKKPMEASTKTKTEELDPGIIDYTTEMKDYDPFRVREAPCLTEFSLAVMNTPPGKSRLPEGAEERPTPEETVIPPSETHETAEPDMSIAPEIPKEIPIENEDSPLLKETPPDEFWVECERGEGSLGLPWQVPASPKNKKKNHARRERRMATQRRLKEEKRKEKERKERLLKREEQKQRRKANPKKPKVPYPENPVRIQLANKHWTLPKRSDLGTYVIRKLPGKITRVWIQPCWIRKCSARKFLNQQVRKDVLRFLRCAVKVQAPEKIDAVQDFIENPYFLRTQYLSTGRAAPDLANKWKVEDEIESSKGTGKWRSVAERIKKRKQEGKRLCKKLGRHPEPIEEISYLTVDCDFQEVPSLLPVRERQKTPERGFYFATHIHEPIEGPKTLKEVQEEFKLIQKTIDYLAYREQHQMSLKTESDDVRKIWTPRGDEMEIDQNEQVPAKVVIEEFGDAYDWILRKGLEWQDFRFLVNSRLGHDRWEAYMNNFWWAGEKINGSIIRPHAGQEIKVAPSWLSRL